MQMFFPTYRHEAPLEESGIDVARGKLIVSFALPVVHGDNVSARRKGEGWGGGGRENETERKIEKEIYF